MTRYTGRAGNRPRRDCRGRRRAHGDFAPRACLSTHGAYGVPTPIWRAAGGAIHHVQLDPDVLTQDDGFCIESSRTYGDVIRKLISNRR
jgi:hypothetical protein